MKTRKMLFLIVLLTLILTACTSDTPATPYPNEVNWETAVRIIHSGQVEIVFQSHALDVTLTMKDGAEVHTIEPYIDAVFDEVDKCGNPCKDIILATE